MDSNELRKIRAQVVTIQEQLQLVLEAIDRLDPDSQSIQQMTKTGEFRLDQELRTIPDFPQVACVHKGITILVTQLENPGMCSYEIPFHWPTVEELLSLSETQVKRIRYVGKKRAKEIIAWVKKHDLEFNGQYFLV